MTAAAPRLGVSWVQVWLTMPVASSNRETIECPGGPLALFWWMWCETQDDSGVISMFVSALRIENTATASSFGSVVARSVTAVVEVGSLLLARLMPHASRLG